MEILKRTFAPLTDAAWEAISAEAKEVFRLNLSARSVVDVGEPRGFAFSALNLGRVEVPKGGEKGPVRYGIRQVLPVVEVRASFELDLWELDNLERGARNPNLDNLRRAAKELAKFEEQALYSGFKPAGIAGLLTAAKFAPVPVATEPAALPDAVTRAVVGLRYADVDGPYALALGAPLYQLLVAGAEAGYPIRRRIEKEIGGPIVLAPFLPGGALVSRRGGDAELALGQDISIGYEHHTGSTVRLYFGESFAFRVLTPEAIVPLEAQRGTTRSRGASPGPPA